MLAWADEEVTEPVLARTTTARSDPTADRPSAATRMRRVLRHDRRADSPTHRDAGWGDRQGDGQRLGAEGGRRGSAGGAGGASPATVKHEVIDPKPLSSNEMGVITSLKL
jgi:hypothetical protein